MNCLSCLDKCNAQCCKQMVFAFPPTALNEKVKYFYKTHGVGVLEKDSYIFLIVPVTCPHLVDNKCDLYGKSERPTVCTQGYEEYLKYLVYPPHCGYKPDKLPPSAVALTEEDMKKAFDKGGDKNG